SLRPPPAPTPFPYTTLFRSHPLLTGPAAPGDAAGVELRPRDICVRPDDPRHLPHAVGNHHLGPFVHPVGDRPRAARLPGAGPGRDRKSTRLNSSHVKSSYAV